MMSQRPQSKLSTPARKFFACQLLCCSPDDKATSSSSQVDKWIYCTSPSGSHIEFSQVWLQGIVVLVSLDGNNILLDDGTAIVHATGITKIVKEIGSFCKGKLKMGCLKKRRPQLTSSVTSKKRCFKADLHGAFLSHATSLRHTYDTKKL